MFFIRVLNFHREIILTVKFSWSTVIILKLVMSQWFTEIKQALICAASEKSWRGAEVTTREEPKNEFLTLWVLDLKVPSGAKQLLNASRSFFSLRVSSAGGYNSDTLSTNTALEMKYHRKQLIGAHMILCLHKRLWTFDFDFQEQQWSKKFIPVTPQIWKKRWPNEWMNVWDWEKPYERVVRLNRTVLTQIKYPPQDWNSSCAVP